MVLPPVPPMPAVPPLPTLSAPCRPLAIPGTVPLPVGRVGLAALHANEEGGTSRCLWDPALSPGLWGNAGRAACEAVRAGCRCLFAGSVRCCAKHAGGAGAASTPVATCADATAATASPEAPRSSCGAPRATGLYAYASIAEGAVGHEGATGSARAHDATQGAAATAPRPGAASAVGSCLGRCAAQRGPFAVLCNHEQSARRSDKEERAAAWIGTLPFPKQVTDLQPAQAQAGTTAPKGEEQAKATGAASQVCKHEQQHRDAAHANAQWRLRS